MVEQPIDEKLEKRIEELERECLKLRQEADELRREKEKYKRIEKALHKSKERYALATRAARVGVWDWNIQTNEFYLDANVKAILGYRDEEIPNDLEIWAGYVHPDDKQPVMDAFQAHIDGKTPEYVYEHRMQHKDGSIRWIMVRGMAIRDTQGNPIRVIGTDSDVTQRKQVEEELRNARDDLEQRVTERTSELARINDQLKLEIVERKRTENAFRDNEERYRALSDASFEAIFISEKGICIDTNQTATEMFGYGYDELIGIFGADVIAPESKELIKQYMLSGYEEPYEAIAQRKDGTTFQVEIRGKMTEYKGRSVRLTVVHDIDKSKKMEDRLRESEKKYREIFELSPEAIVLLDRKGNILNVNARPYDWLGYSPEEVVGKSFLDLPFLSKQGKAQAMAKFSQRMAGKKVSPYDLVFYTKSGEKRVGRIMANPIQDENGEIVQNLVMISDITEGKQAELALQEREAELKARSRDLEEVNAALKVLLKKREGDKSELEERVLFNVNELIVPYLKKLKKSRSNALQQTYLNVLETNLNEIISPFYRTLSANYVHLTPREIQIADLVKQGKTTKEIGELMNSSTRAVEFHRNNIRKKLGLANQKTNLRSYLLTLQ
jgi:PAS domain S-box-containing protein